MASFSSSKSSSSSSSSSGGSSSSSSSSGGGGRYVGNIYWGGGKGNSNIISQNGNRNSAVDSYAANKYYYSDKDKNTYGNRETAYTIVSPTGKVETIYSNYTNYKDALAAAGKSDYSLKNATTYGVASSGGGTSYGSQGYTSNSPASGGFYYDAMDRLNNSGGNIQNNNQNYNGEINIADIDWGYGQYAYNVEPPSIDFEYSGMSPDEILSMYEGITESQLDSIRQKTEAIKKQYESQRGNVDNLYNENARQAYIAKRQAEMNLPQQLAASGISGGLSESSIVGINANYQDNLNSNEIARNSSMTEIDNAILNAEITANSDMAAAEKETKLAAIKAYQQQLDALNAYKKFVAEYQLSAYSAASQNAYRNWQMQQSAAKEAESKLRYNVELALKMNDWKAISELTGLSVDAAQKRYDMSAI